MTARTFHILQNALYLLVIVVLCSKVHRPYTELDGLFKEHYVRDEQDKKARIKNMIGYTKWKMNEPGQFDKMEPCYKQMLFMDSLTKEMISYLNEKETKPVFPDSLKNTMNNYFKEILTQIPIDSEALSPFIDNNMRADFTLWEKPNWAMNILAHQTQAKRQLLFAMLRSNVYNAEVMVSKRLTELYHDHGDYWDTIGVVTYAANRLYNVDDRVSCDLILATLPMHDWIECYEKDKLLKKAVRAGSIWNDTAHEVGDYTVNGVLRVHTFGRGRDSDYWDTLPWSFQYRVIAKGASIIRTGHQVCYRNVANPLSVTVPGYAPDKVRLWAKGATVVNNNDGTGAITITDKRTDKVIIYADATDKRGHTATVHAAEFAVRDMPAPLLLINGKETTTIAMAELSHPILMSVVWDDDDWPQASIAQYDVCLIGANNKLLGDYTIKGSALAAGNDAAKQAFAQLNTGGRIYISNIQVKTKLGDVVPPAPVGLLVQ